MAGKLKKIIKLLIKKMVNLIAPTYTIIMESVPDYGDNTRVFFDYLISKGINKKYHFIWLVNNPDQFTGLQIENVQFVNYNKFLNYKNILNIYKLARAKYIITCNRTIHSITSRQASIYLGHGTPLKYIGDVYNGSMFDYLLVPSEYLKPYYQKSMNIQSKQVIISGSPRNDLLFEKADYRKQFSISDEIEKIVTWMPTFRQHKNLDRIDSEAKYELGIPIIESVEQFEHLNEYLKGRKIILFIKPHPAQDISKLFINSLCNIKVITTKDLDEKCIQLYSFLGMTDALITDYSSVFFDYLLLDRPMGFTLDDLEQYDQGRGFTLEKPLDYMAGHHIYNYDDILTFFNNLSAGVDNFKEKRQKILNLTNEYKDADNCKRLYEYLNL